MGCDWVALRNVTVSLGVFVGFAITSVMCALAWESYAPDGPWKSWVLAASYGSAVAWCTTALVIKTYLNDSSSGYLDDSSAGYLDSRNPAWSHATLVAENQELTSSVNTSE
jgi:hypothetical protein